MRKEVIKAIRDTAGNFQAADFYRKLFANFPATQSLFPAEEQMPAQHERLTDAIVAVASGLEDFAAVRPWLQALGRRHVRSYGVQAEHYGVVGATLLESFQPPLQADERQAWAEAYAAITTEMQLGTEQKGDE
jgi:hemoglobin-like flavoprotein